MTETVLDRVTCARCIGKVNVRAPSIACERCGQVYPRAGRIPVLLPQPDAHLAFWRKQLAFITAQGAQTLAALEEQAAATGLLPDTRVRLLALAKGVRDQAEDLAALVRPALGAGAEGHASPAELGNPLQYSHYLYRDWGWEHGAAGHTENQTSLDEVRSVLGPMPLGRTLVLGAGGCRLAYDLHRTCGATETAVLDIDPFLLIIAEAVLRGAEVRITESTANIQQTLSSAVRWTLRAPAGGLDASHFHVLFGNGLAPPFESGTFDSVITPWFIDQVPPDLPAFLRTLTNQLRPGGRWLNHGPLIYPANAPLTRRYAREEVFALAGAAGFRIERWHAESRPYLASPLNGRGKLEWVLSFEATRT